MTTYFFKFDTKEQAEEVFSSAGIDITDGIPSSATIGGEILAIDVVFGNGIVYRQTGVMLTGEDGNEYPETEAVSGYHVNVSAMPDALREFMLDPQPSFPKCVFA